MATKTILSNPAPLILARLALIFDLPVSTSTAILSPPLWARMLTGRAFGDLVSEMDIYSLIRSRVLSRGRYGRTREIILDLPQGLTEKIYACVLLNFEIPN